MLVPSPPTPASLHHPVPGILESISLRGEHSALLIPDSRTRAPQNRLQGLLLHCLPRSPSNRDQPREAEEHPGIHTAKSPQSQGRLSLFLSVPAKAG